MSKTQKLLLRARSQLQLLHFLCEVQAKGWTDGDPDWVTRGKDGRFGGGSTQADSAADTFAKLADRIAEDIETFGGVLPKEQRLVVPGFINPGLANLYRESIVLQGKMTNSSNDEMLAKLISYADASALAKSANPVSKVMSEELERRGLVVEKVIDDSGESGFKAWGINDKNGSNPRLVITGTELKLNDIADIREDLLATVRTVFWGEWRGKLSKA